MNFSCLTRFGGLLLLGSTILLAACNDHLAQTQPATTVVPQGPPPAYAPNIDPQMLAVLEQFLAYKTPPLPTLTPRQARMAPSITDAVLELIVKNGIAASRQLVDISQRVIPGAAPDGTLLRIYTPTNTSAPAGGWPVVVYAHGGGWVIGSLDVYDPSCRALAVRSGAIVVSVDYRLSPEAKFPSAHEDVYSSYAWVKANAATIGGNAAKVAVAGESAGANMAAGVCLLAKERGLAQPVHQLLVYPVANNDLNTPSYNQYANAQPLNRPGVVYFTQNYFNSPADGDNRLISLVDVADLRNTAPATVIGAEIDPLQTEGQQLTQRFRDFAVPVSYQLYPGTTHEFFGTYAVVQKAGQAQDFAAQQLRAAFR
jgi:acetyl esterase